jgi:hypothetical protein
MIWMTCVLDGREHGVSDEGVAAGADWRAVLRTAVRRRLDLLAQKTSEAEQTVSPRRRPCTLCST